MCQLIRKHLRKRFQLQYLGVLIYRAKCIYRNAVKPTASLSTEYDNLKRIFWPLGKMTTILTKQRCVFSTSSSE